MDIAVRPHHAADRHARPRHAGNLGGPRRLSGHELDSRQPVDRLLGRAAASTASTSRSREVRDIPFHVTGTRFVEDAVRQQKEVAPDQLRDEDGPLRPEEPGRLAASSMKRSAICGSRDGAGGDAAAPDARRRIRKLSRPGRATGARSPMSPGTTTRPDGSRSSASGGGEGRIVTPEPGHYVEPAFSPDGSLIAYRKTSDGFLTTPLYGQRSRPLCRRRARAARRSGSRRAAPSRMFGATNDRIFFTATGEEDKRLAEVGRRSPGRRRSPTSFPKTPSDFALSPDEQFVAWTERYQAYVMPFVRSGRSIDIAPDGKALPAVARSAPMPATGSTGRATAAAFTGARGPTCYGRDVGIVGRLRRRQDRPRRRWSPNSVSPPRQAKPSGSIALTGARIVTMRGDEVIENGTVLIDGDRIAAVGPTASISYPAGTPHHRRHAARPSSPA